MKQCWIVINLWIVVVFVGCTPEIGDACNEDLDCSIDGSRFCDTSQDSDGYCIIADCRANSCPEEAVCVQFRDGVGGRNFCMRHCQSNGDCRSGYKCQAPSAGDIQFAQSSIIDEHPRGNKYCLKIVPIDE